MPIEFKSIHLANWYIAHQSQLLRRAETRIAQLELELKQLKGKSHV